jgi:hypothetical protein
MEETIREDLIAFSYRFARDKPSCTMFREEIGKFQFAPDPARIFRANCNGHTIARQPKIARRGKRRGAGFDISAESLRRRARALAKNRLFERSRFECGAPCRFQDALARQSSFCVRAGRLGTRRRAKNAATQHQRACDASRDSRSEGRCARWHKTGNVSRVIAHASR